MGYYKLLRQAKDGKAVHGTLYAVEYRYSGSSGKYIEYLTPVCETLENADYLIPALIYRITVTQSPKFKRLLPFINQVPGRTGIRVHRGALPEHSRGCILVSAENEKQITELWLTEQHEKQETRLEICAQ